MSWEADLAAYNRLRSRGLNPRSINGSAALEHAAPTRDSLSWGWGLTAEQIDEQRTAIALAELVNMEHEREGTGWATSLS